MPREMTNDERAIVDALNAALDSGTMEQIRRLWESFQDKCGAALCDDDNCPLDLYGAENRLAAVGIYRGQPFPDQLRVEGNAAPGAIGAEIVLYENPADAISGAAVQPMGDVGEN